MLALKEGRMRIVTDHEPFSRQYTAINGLSVTGLNTHVLLHGQYRPKVQSKTLSLNCYSYLSLAVLIILVLLTSLGLLVPN